jgi:hypothetical protein
MVYVSLEVDIRATFTPVPQKDSSLSKKQLDYGS